jgi:hypothetical protein
MEIPEPVSTEWRGLDGFVLAPGALFADTCLEAVMD